MENTSPRGRCTSRRRFLAILPGLGLLQTGLARADDGALLRELQAGAVLLMRHAQTVPGVGDPPGMRLGDCSTQRNLSAEGEAHAQRIGAWLRQQRLSFDAVRNSPWCRTRETARLALGRSEDWPALRSIFEDRSGAQAQADEVRRFIAGMKAGQRALLVTHSVNIADIVPGAPGLAPGEFVAVRAGGPSAAKLQVLGRFRVP